MRLPAVLHPFAMVLTLYIAGSATAQERDAETDPRRNVNIIAGAGLSFLPGFEKLRDMEPDDPFLNPDPSAMLIGFTIAMWKDLPGTQLKLGAQSTSFFSLDEGVLTYRLLAHPNSLRGDIVRVIIEAEPIGDNPTLELRFGADAELEPVHSTPVPLGDGWSRHEFTIIRPSAGEPMGAYVDMFQYTAGDVDVRHFQVHDLGVKGDVNLDGQVDMQDIAIVLGNYAQSGNLQIEDGDTNLDGTVDMIDVTNVIEAILND